MPRRCEFQDKKQNVSQHHSTTLRGYVGPITVRRTFVQACIGAIVCFQTIHSYWGSVDGVKTSAEGYVAPAIIAFLNLMVLITGWDLLFKI